MIKSHALLDKDFKSEWYQKWAKELRQDKNHLQGHALLANKFWQNAVMTQALFERNMLHEGAKAIGFGVGSERLPALFAKYGVHVTATDQDFRTKKAEHWSKAELARGLESLNQLAICPAKQFTKYVEYRPLDMTDIPASLENSYDFLWSNCALGHLGSIEQGLGFIEKSLKCLKPGGWAVHTTEMNTLSDDETVKDGDTVVFRLQDVHRLAQKLTSQGYVVSPLRFELGTSGRDMRICLRPEFGNDYSKIQIRGHLLTQVVLIIHKPKRKPRLPVSKLALDQAYRSNKNRISAFKKSPAISKLYKSHSAPIEAIVLEPAKSVIKLRLKRSARKTIEVAFKNNSEVYLFAMDAHLEGGHPILLATANPHDRKSLFNTDTWVGKNRNRLSADIRQMPDSDQLADHVKPGQLFAFRVQLNASGVKSGTYKESVCVVQEHVGWVANSDVLLDITVA